MFKIRRALSGESLISIVFHVICNCHLELGCIIVIQGVCLFVLLILSSAKFTCVRFLEDIPLWCGAPPTVECYDDAVH